MFCLDSVWETEKDILLSSKIPSIKLHTKIIRSQEGKLSSKALLTISCKDLSKDLQQQSLTTLSIKREQLIEDRKLTKRTEVKSRVRLSIQVFRLFLYILVVTHSSVYVFVFDAKTDKKHRNRTYNCEQYCLRSHRAKDMTTVEWRREEGEKKRRERERDSNQCNFDPFYRFSLSLDFKPREERFTFHEKSACITLNSFLVLFHCFYSGLWLLLSLVIMTRGKLGCLFLLTIKTRAEA